MPVTEPLGKTGAVATATGDEAGPTRQRRRWRAIAGAIAGAGVVVVLLVLVARQWEQIPKGTLRPNWCLVAVSFLLFRVAAFCSCLLWRAVLGAVGGHISIVQAYVVRTLAQLGRYIPGKVMVVAARAYLCAREGVSLRVATMSAVYDHALFIVSAAVVVCIWLASGARVLPSSYRWVCGGLTVVGLASLHPRIVTMALRLISRVVRRDLDVQPLRYRTMLWLGAGYGAAWGVYGLAFYAFLRAFQPLPLGMVLDCTGILAVGLVAGLVFLIAPSGLGVREGLVTVLLSAYIPLEVAAAIALALRVLMTAGELLSVGVALVLRRRLSQSASTGLPGPRPGASSPVPRESASET